MLRSRKTPLTDASGDYGFNDVSPGTYTVTITPQTGYTQTAPASTSYTVTIANDGQVVKGENFGEVERFPALAVSNVAFNPATASLGQAETFTWKVSNTGLAPADGAWLDAVYLSPTPTLGASAVLLTTVLHNGPLTAGGTYNGSATVDLPPSALGTNYVIVQTDWLNQVPQSPFGAALPSEVAASTSTLTANLPTITPGTPVRDTFTRPGEGRYYQISVAPGQTLTLTLDIAASTGENDLYIRCVRSPMPATSMTPPAWLISRTETLTVPSTAGGIYYVYVETIDGAASDAAFTLTASLPTFQIATLGLTSGGNTGQVTIPIVGALLTTSTTAMLFAGSTVIAASAVYYQDASHVFATFNLAGKSTGTYSVELQNGTETWRSRMPSRSCRGKRERSRLRWECQASLRRRQRRRDTLLCEHRQY